MAQLSIFEQEQRQEPDGMEEGTLPSGWAEAPIRDLALLIRGVTYEKVDATPQYRDGSVPVLRASNIQSDHLETERDLVFVPQRYAKPEQMLEPGDIVICMSSGSKHLVGKTAQVLSQWRGSFGAFCAVARFNAALNHRFAGYFFASPRYREFIRSQSSGVNINNLRHGDIAALSYPIPPLAEQGRIVAAIEEQFARLDAGVVALKRAQANLKRYKAAVLKAACEGALVPQDPGDEPAAALLARILAARRAKWEADLRAIGKNPATARYDETAAPNTDDLPALPDGWCWVNLGDLARVVDPHPSHRTPSEVPGGIPYVGLGDIRSDGALDVAGARKVAHTVLSEHQNRYSLRSGDFIFGKIGTLGRPFRLPEPYSYTLSANVILIQPERTSVDAAYSFIYLASPFVEDVLAKTSRATTQAAFGIQRLRLLPFPLPPEVEQKRIVAEVERRLSVVQGQEIVIAHSLKRAERLRQAILAQAFAGRLVPQDPSDEPASALLARVRAGREPNRKSAGKQRAYTRPLPVT